jgi:hypothetical protein
MLMIATIVTDCNEKIEVMLKAEVSTWKEVLSKKLKTEIMNGHIKPFKAKEIYVREMK